MTRRAITAIVVVAALGALAHSAPPDQPARSATTDGPLKLFVGQPLVEATTGLEKRGIEFSEGGFAFAKGDPDQSHLIIVLDKNHTYVCAFFSKSQSRLTDLRMVFFPSRKLHAKGNESWLAATEVIVHDDRSYSVRFAPPISEDGLQTPESNRPKPQLPAN